MKLTVGVCLGPGFNRYWLCSLIQSIQGQIDPKDHEILLIGGDPGPNEEFEDCRHIPFDEKVRSGWITRKKNILAQEAKFDKMVITHDYYSFSPYWYEGVATYTKRHPDWQILLNQVRTAECYRSADWLVNPRRMCDLIMSEPWLADDLMSVAPDENGPQWVNGLPYHVDDLNHIQYVPGGFFMVDREVIRNVPLNEDLGWGDEEDLDWSNRLIAAGCKFEFLNNPEVYVSIQKPNKWRMRQMPDNVVERLRNFFHGSV